MGADGPRAATAAPAVAGVEILHRGWGRFLRVRVTLGDGRALAHEVEDHGSAASVLPYDPERRIALLVRQLRVPALLAAGLGGTLEAPAGLIEAEPAEACARREALEEAGVRLGALEPVARAWAMPAVSTETVDLFLAPFGPGDVVEAGGGIAAEGESVAVEAVPLARLAAMADAGDLTDMKTLVLVLTLRHRRPDLFCPYPKDP